MGALLVFVRKLISLCGACTEEVEPREPPTDVLKIFLDNSLSSDNNGRRALVSRLPSTTISNRNERNENDGLNKSPWSSAEEIKVELEMHSESLLTRPQLDALQIRSDINYVSLKESTESDLLPVEVAKEVPNLQNEQITVETSKRHSPSSDSKVNVVSVPLGSSKTGCILAVTGSSPSLLGPQKTQLVPQNRSYDDDDVSKGKLICPQNGNTESDPRPVKRKKKGSKSKREIEGYCISQKILLVGEGNFSFSACLARSFGSATNMVATSF